MKPIVLIFLAGLLIASGFAQDKPAIDAKAGNWISMFDGKTLQGWEANEKPENWKVENGAIRGRGDRSHLFWKVKECGDCEFEAEVKLNKGGNSGMYVRAEFGLDWPKGYEAQVNNSHKDPKRTGSLYNIVNVFEQLVPDDTWWTQRVSCVGNHIVISVNGRKVVDTIEQKNQFTKGFLALQQHDPGSAVEFRKLRMRELTPLKK